MFPSVAPSSSYPPPEAPPPEPSRLPKIVVIVAAVVCGLTCLFVLYDLATRSSSDLKARVAALEQKQKAMEATQHELSHHLQATSSQFETALSQQVASKEELAARASELEREQKAASSRLAAQQSQQGKQLAAMTGEVTNVKTDVGSAKTDLQKTQSDLAATNAKLERAIGDLGVQSGLIAHNSQELEVLKHKGDRNYYDFVLRKGVRTPVSTVSLQLKKVDPGKSKFTMSVMADDRTIEKKDRTVNEPLQFYSGREHMLYEVVVFTADKSSVTGYLSTPKNAPVPVTP